MKKFLKIAGISFGSLLVIMFAAPFLFKDKIKGVIDEQIKKNVNGNVWYDANSFSLSLFTHFPNLTVSISDIGLTSNVEAFKDDTLFAAKNFSLALNLMSVVSGDQIKINGVYLDKPYVLTKYDRAGNFSWDITFPDTTAAAPTPEEPSAPLNIKVSKWAITDGHIIYEDQTMPMYMEMQGFNHEGSGDMAADVFDLVTKTSIEKTVVDFDGTRYMNGTKVTADATMNIDLKNSVYTFKENEFGVNDFKFGFDGKVEMPADDIKMDLTYKAHETDFKNVLSLVPAIYAKDFESIKTEGTLGFDGFAKGVYNDKSLPAFELNFFVNNGFFQYPSLPESVKNINIDLHVANKDGVVEHTLVNLKKFHMELGKNPIDAKFVMDGMAPYKLDANLLAKFKLEDIQKFYPVDGTDMRGNFAADIKVKGVYDEATKKMPTVNATTSLDNGYVKSTQFPEAIKDFSFKSTVISNGDMPTSTLNLEYFKFLLDGEPFSMKAFVKNFDDPNYDVNVKGKIDLTKMTKIYPIENTTLSGIILADLSTKGVLSEVQNGVYTNTQTSGTMDIDNMNYISSVDLPQGFKITKGQLSLTPQSFTIAQMDGFAGKSDYSVTGVVSNYMGYLFGGKDSLLHGKMNFDSKKFDANEWTAEDPNAPVPTADTASVAMEVIEIPYNIDFTFTSAIGSVLYDTYKMDDFKGMITVKESILSLKNIGFNMLDGAFLMSMTYNAQSLAKPLFDMNFGMKNVAFKEAYKTFNSVKKLAGVAQYMEGKMDMNVMMDGVLGQDMMPKYETVNGSGNVNTHGASLKGNPAMSAVSSVTKMKNLDPMNIGDILVKFKIIEGAVALDPFKFQSGDTKFAVNKALNKLNGDIDYDMQLNTPSGSMGSAAAGAMSNLVGQNVSMPKDVIIDYNLSGPSKKPAVKILKTNFGEVSKQGAVDAVKNSQQAQDAQAQIDQAKKDAELKAQQELDKQKAAAQAELDKQKAAAEAEAAKQKAAAEAEAQRKMDEAKKKADAEAKKKAADALKGVKF
jgi:F0F1-type ATP synthase membrane subunit b/b'